MVAINQSSESILNNVGVNLRCRYIGMAQHLLQTAQIRTVRQKMAGKCMSQHVRAAKCPSATKRGLAARATSR